MSTILIHTSPARVRPAGLERRAIDPCIEACPLEGYRGSNPLAQLRRTFDCWLARAPFELLESLQRGTP